ncbi:MAG: glycosyltransferase [Methanobacteriaceae archaeon]|nr:glycosyltransferase [Methanobacteriaceae archaeon]
MKNPIKVVVFPELSHSYLKLLYSEIGKNSEIEISSYNGFKTILRIIKSNIIHFHWIEGFFIGFDPEKRNIITIFMRTCLYLSFLTFLKIIKKKIVITLHNVESHDQVYPYLERKIFKLSLNIADNIIVHNSYGKIKAQDMYNIESSKFHIIPMGNYSNFYPNYINKAKSREILEIPKNKFVISFVGNIKEYKGIEDLLKVLDNILVNNNSIHIIIAGKCIDKELCENIQSFEKKHKYLSTIKLDYIDDEKLQIYINASDIGILPYKRITNSAILMLFMSFYKPVIVPSLEPIKELIGDNCIYYEPSSKNDLEEKIKRAESGLYNLNNISKNLIDVTKNNNWNNIAFKTIKIYKNLVKK